MTDTSDLEARPVAWRHASMERSIGAAGMHDIISDEVKALWLKANPRQVEHYTVPLYDADALAAQREEIERLTQERDSSRGLVKEICEEWNEDCEPCCNSYGHDENCRAVHISAAKRALRERAEKAEAQLAEAQRRAEETQNFIGQLRDVCVRGQSYKLGERIVSMIDAATGGKDG